MNSVRIDVSRNRGAAAVLVLESRRKIAIRSALGRFRRSVSQWLANTDEGKAAWKDARGCFDYGDFYQRNVNALVGFRKFLNANGLEGAYVNLLEAEDLGEAWDHEFRPEGME